MLLNMTSTNIFSISLFFVFINDISMTEIRRYCKDKREICVNSMNSIQENIAVQAAEEASYAAKAQNSAAYQASHRIKQELAEKDNEAAGAARDAAAVKAALVEEIKKENEAVKLVITELTRSKKRIEQAIESQLKALQAEESVMKILLDALQVAKSTSNSADLAIRGIQHDLIEKERILRSALYATNVLTREERSAINDVKVTKSATRQAMMAANLAMANIMRMNRMVY